MLQLKPVEEILTHYVINNHTVFNDKDGSLRHLVDEDPTNVLSAPAALLLAYFIQHLGEDLAREDILFNVWEKNGKVASGNNLNHYTSILRKALNDMGHHDLIITIPKFGFCFNAQIEIIDSEEQHEKQIETSIASQIIANPVEKIELVELKEVVHSTKPRQGKFLIALVGALSVIIVLIIMNSPIRNQKVIPLEHITPLLLGEIDHCTVYAMRSTNKDRSEYLLSQSKKKMAELGINCQIPATVYIHFKMLTHASSSIESDIFYYCRLDQSGEKSARKCTNIIYNNELSV